MRLYRLLLLFITGLFVLNCSARPDLRQINHNLQQLTLEAERLLQTGQAEEGLHLVKYIQRYHPDDPEITKLLANLTTEQKKIFQPHPYLGSNIPDSVPVHSGILKKILWYIPDRLSDLLDVFSFEINAGPQIGFELWTTRAVQVGLYTGTTFNIGYKKKYGLVSGVADKNGIVFGPIGYLSSANYTTGFSRTNAVTDTIKHHTPGKHLYQNYRDYYGVGFKLGAIGIGAEVEFHLIEIFDFLAGIFLFDPLKDDFANSRKLKYTRHQKQLLKSTMKLGFLVTPAMLKKYQQLYPLLHDDSKVPDETLVEKKQVFIGVVYRVDTSGKVVVYFPKEHSKIPMKKRLEIRNANGKKIATVEVYRNNFTNVECLLIEGKISDIEKNDEAIGY